VKGKNSMETLEKEKINETVKSHYGKIAKEEVSGCCGSDCCEEDSKSGSNQLGYSETLEKEKIHETVKSHYGKIAKGEVSGCCGSDCCEEDSKSGSKQLGYSEAELKSIPEGSDLSLGCGNPLGIASIKNGETVLDLGSGAGFDCFLASIQTGKNGTVIGVDMTPDMIDKAKANASKGNYENVEFRLGNIEMLPVKDNSIDVIISNCVINLSPDKQKVFDEAYRVLKSGGRMAVSDIIAYGKLPSEVKENLSLYAGCIAGASDINEVKEMLANSGFRDIKISPKDSSKEFIKDWLPGMKIEDYIISANIEAVK